MPQTISVGKFRSCLFTVRNADGSVNTTATLSATPGNATKLRVRVNPANNREVGVVGLEASAGINANVSVTLPGGTFTANVLFTVTALNQEGLEEGTWSDPEANPPAWMQ